MKSTIVSLLVLLQLLTAGTALATNVDFFSALGTNQFGISGPSRSSGWTYFPQSDASNYLTMWYNDGTDPLSTDPQNPIGFAQVDWTGIFGDSAGGPLVFDFNSTQRALSFHFSLLGEISPLDGLAISFFNDGNLIDFATALTPDLDINGNSSGLLMYKGPLFNEAAMFFFTDNANVPLFTIDSVNYSAVPEPASFGLISIGLLGMGGWTFRRRHHQVLG